MKKLLLLGATALIIGVTSVSAASKFNSPAEIVSSLTNKSVDTVIDEKQSTNKTYGEMASEEGVYEQFQTEMREMKKDIILQKLADGEITQEKADEIIEYIETHDCINGTMPSEYREYFGFGQMNGTGCGNRGRGNGRGRANR